MEAGYEEIHQQFGEMSPSLCVLNVAANPRSTPRFHWVGSQRSEERLCREQGQGLRKDQAKRPQPVTPAQRKGEADSHRAPAPCQQLQNLPVSSEGQGAKGLEREQPLPTRRNHASGSLPSTQSKLEREKISVARAQG